MSTSCPADSTVYSGTIGGMGSTSLGTFAAGETHRYQLAVTFPDGGTNGADNSLPGCVHLGRLRLHGDGLGPPEHSNHTVTLMRPALGRAACGIHTMSPSAQRIRNKVVIAALALVATSLVWSGGTFSAFNKTSAMPGNSVAAGTVVLARQRRRHLRPLAGQREAR